LTGRFRPNAVHYGVVAGLGAVAVEAFFGVRQPSAYGVCMACHGQDLVGWFTNHLVGTHLAISPDASAAPLLTTVGVFLGAGAAAARNGELRWRRVMGSPLASLLLGALIAVFALIVAGCPTRLWLRLAYGDPAAVAAVPALVLGVVAGTAVLRRRAA